MFTKTRRRPLYLILSLLLLYGCELADSPAKVAYFCQTLNQINAGGVDTSGLRELEGHALVVESLLGASPPSIRGELGHIHKTIDDWAAAVSGDRPMIETFKQLSDPQLVGSEGRLSDYIANNCDLDLGGLPWLEDKEQDTAPVCPDRAI